MSTQLVSVSESCFKWLLFCGCGSHPPAQEHEEEEEEEDAAPPEPAPLAKLVEDQSGCKKEFDDWIEEHMGGLIKRWHPQAQQGRTYIFPNRPNRGLRLILLEDPAPLATSLRPAPRAPRSSLLILAPSKTSSAVVTRARGLS